MVPLSLFLAMTVEDYYPYGLMVEVRWSLLHVEEYEGSRQLICLGLICTRIRIYKNELKIPIFVTTLHGKHQWRAVENTMFLPHMRDTAVVNWRSL